MCGIAGIFSYASSAPVDPEVLVRMRDAMVHRGPDGYGLWLADDHKVGLAHRRLAIIDLSNAATQPLCNEDRTVWVTFNGEIYNHVELRKRLLASGHKFITDHSDTEVIVHGYEEWGIDGLVKAIEGDFSIGLWDGNRGRLHLIRDRIGVKPLYFAVRNGVLLFASEIKALLKHPAVSPAVDMAAMQHYLTFLTTPAPLTMFEGIFKLPAGHFLTAERDGALTSRRYWDALPGQSRFAGLRSQLVPDESLVAGEIRAELMAAVERRVMSDVPYGVLLSGGIDSTTNLAMMSKLVNRPIETFTVGFSDYPEGNETDEARSAAREFGANHHEVLISRKDMSGYLDALVHTQDEPIADWVCVPLHFVSKLARDSGVIVVQVGEGADEQFVGYQHYFKYGNLDRLLNRPLAGVPRMIGSAIARSAEFLSGIFPGIEQHAEFIERIAMRKELFWSGATVYSDAYKRKLLGTQTFAPRALDPDLAGCGLFPETTTSTDTHQLVKEMYRAFDEQGMASDFYTRMIYSEFKLRLPELLLMRVDKIAMSSSLEARVPFLDHRLVELTMDLPETLRVGPGLPKYLLKKSVRGLIPQTTIDRRKRGFDAPMSQWLRGDFGRHVESQLLQSHFVRQGVFRADYIRRLFSEHRGGRERAMFIWTLFNLTEWYKYWIH